MFPPYAALVFLAGAASHPLDHCELPVLRLPQGGPREVFSPYAAVVFVAGAASHPLDHCELSVLRLPQGGRREMFPSYAVVVFLAEAPFLYSGPPREFPPGV